MAAIGGLLSIAGGAMLVIGVEKLTTPADLIAGGAIAFLVGVSLLGGAE